MSKALVLLSGGLDSMLATKTLQNQGVEVTGLSFKSCFFDCAKARISAKQLGIKLIEVDFSDEHLVMLKNPKYGYGKNMNPCIDCHSMMVRYANEILKKEGYDFIATGEVLGQRPMSQNRDALNTVANYSGAEKKILRPLSAKLLEPTEPEELGLLKRGKLHRLEGRNREGQMELVEKFGIKEYASPGGGCLLTDPAFSERLVDLFEYWPEATGNDIELLKHGRIFWLKTKTSKILIVVGRHKEDNENLADVAQSGDILLELKDEMGPITLIRKLEYKEDILNIDIPENLKKAELGFTEVKTEEEILNIASLLTGWYATKMRGKNVDIKISIKN